MKRALREAAQATAVAEGRVSELEAEAEALRARAAAAAEHAAAAAACAAAEQHAEREQAANRARDLGAQLAGAHRQLRALETRVRALTSEAALAQYAGAVLGDGNTARSTTASSTTASSSSSSGGICTSSMGFHGAGWAAGMTTEKSMGGAGGDGAVGESRCCGNTKMAREAALKRALREGDPAALVKLQQRVIEELRSGKAALERRLAAQAREWAAVAHQQAQRQTARGKEEEEEEEEEEADEHVTESEDEGDGWACENGGVASSNAWAATTVTPRTGSSTSAGGPGLALCSDDGSRKRLASMGLHSSGFFGPPKKPRKGSLLPVGQISAATKRQGASLTSRNNPSKGTEPSLFLARYPPGAAPRGGFLPSSRRPLAGRVGSSHAPGASTHREGHREGGADAGRPRKEAPRTAYELFATYARPAAKEKARAKAAKNRVPAWCAPEAAAGVDMELQRQWASLHAGERKAYEARAQREKAAFDGSSSISRAVPPKDLVDLS